MGAGPGRPRSVRRSGLGGLPNPGARPARGRQWQAAAGESALLSFVYAVPPLAQAGQLGLVAALAVADALASLTGLDPRLKWPNDILLDGYKAAGVLVEVAGPLAVLGLGINVNQEAFPGGGEFVYPPTSLRLASGQMWDVEAVTGRVARSLSETEDRWRRDGFGSVLAACRARLAAGAAVRRGGQSGVLAGLTDTGAARVRLPDGTFADWTAVD